MIAASAATEPLFAGIDVGGTKTALVVTDGSERILYQREVPTDRHAVVGQISGLIKTARQQLLADGRDVAAVGVAVPGRVDPSTGAVSMAVNLGISHLALGPLLESEIGLPSFVEHDARAAALWLSSGGDQQAAITDLHAAEVDDAGSTRRSGPADLAYLAVGTGISAGVVVNGDIMRGANGLAGEVGHLVADPAGPACACGLRGCLEAVAAGPAIARQADEAIADGRSTSLAVHSSAAEVLRAAQAGDELATEIAAGVADHLARAIRALTLTFGVKHVVIGGGVAAAGSALLGPLEQRISHERAASALVEAAFSDATVRVLSPDMAAGARGAAAIARRRIGLPQREGVGER
jgi:glucokinase